MEKVKMLDGNYAKVNLEKCDFIAKYEFSNSRDFNYVWETLYKTTTGKYIIDGEGGAMSKYSKNIGDRNFCGSERVYEIDEIEAKEFCERHADIDVVDEYFPLAEI